MSTRLERTFRLPTDPDRAVGAIRNPALIRENERSRGALSTEIKQVEESPTRHVYEIHTETYGRSVTGPDPSKRERNCVRVTWDLAARRGEWVWSGEHKRVGLRGGYTLHPDGGGTRIDVVAEVSVEIPVVGKIAEKKIAEGFEGEWPKWIERIRRYAEPAG